MKSLHNIYSEIMRDVRSGWTMGGSFDGVDKNITVSVLPMKI